MGRAQTRYELGLPAAQFFVDTQAMMPGNMDVLRNRALAMASEGDKAGAEHLLRDALKANYGDRKYGGNTVTGAKEIRQIR
jgi:hypothetical protein